MESQDKPLVCVTLTQEEAGYIQEVLLNAPMQIAVKDMPHLIGMVQSIVKKLQPPVPETPKTEA